MLVGRQLRLYLQPLSAIPSKKLREVIAVGPITLKRIFVEQPLDAAAGTYLVGTALGADRPTHLAMPATPKNDGGASQPGRNQTHGPQPTGTLAFQRL
jgi:hypothetical protein